jgi:hypothetical protein
MYMRLTTLMFGTILLGSLLVGCTQKDDVVTPISRSELTLVPQNLPTAPSGMVYELWISKATVADTNYDMSLATSLGRFSYISTDSVKTFLDESGSPRDGVFELNGDFQTYRSIFVGLHRSSDPAGTRPGAIMLIAYIPSTPDIPIRMVFPQADSLWDATCRYNLEGVSDNNRGTNDARGVWFSSYRSATFDIPDTTAMTVDSSQLDTIKPIIGDCPQFNDTCNIDSLKREYPYTVTDVRVVTERVLFPNDSLILGIDSFMHTRVAYTLIYKADLSYPYVKRRLRFTYSTNGHPVTLDIFSQDEFGLPIVTEWGWKYAGWALTPHVAPSAKVGALTPPAWPYKTYYKDWLPGNAGGMIPTGTFANINAPDDQNPFVLNSYVPPFPGEDFLNPTALTDSLGVGSINLMPTTSGNIGSIMVTLEPQNRLVTNTNFPLIAFIGTLPNRTDSVTAAAVGLNMVNSTSTLLGNQVYSFPIVTVGIKRY